MKQKPKFNYQQRILLAQQKHPELLAGIFDCCNQHDDNCRLLKIGKRCNCNPIITITNRLGKFSVDGEGNCKRLGIEAETTPVMIDPRNGWLN